MPEYQFAVEKCGCGFKLSGRKHVELTGNKGHILLGRCPKCGTTYPLVEIESEPEPEPEPEPQPEPEPEPEPEPTPPEPEPDPPPED